MQRPHPPGHQGRHSRAALLTLSHMRCQDLGLRIRASGFKVWDLRSRVWDSRSRDLGLGPRDRVQGYGILGLGSKV